MTKITAKQNKFFDQKTGFIPNTPKEEIIKHFARIIADKGLDDIIQIENRKIILETLLPLLTIRYKTNNNGEQIFAGYGGINTPFPKS